MFNPDTVIQEGQRYGWWEHDYQWSQGELVILRKNDDDGDQMQLNIWCTTGTVGSYLNHPRRGKTQLFRRSISSYSELREIFNNPRVHGYDGYYRRSEPQTTQRAPKTVPCPACGRMYRTMADTAQHFESGACPHCPGEDAARRAAYGYARQMEAGSDVRFTHAQRTLTFNGDGSTDWSAGYEADGDNYSCPSCGKPFRALHSMLSHIQSRPQCQGGQVGMLKFSHY